jgi:hypothetical protein
VFALDRSPYSLNDTFGTFDAPPVIDHLVDIDRRSLGLGEHGELQSHASPRSESAHEFAV